MVTDTTVLGREGSQPANWHDDIDHMNPLVDDDRYAGQARRFDPPWSEAICVVTADNGAFGVGLTGLAGLVVPLINDYLGPMLIGEAVAELDRLWDMMSVACIAHLGAGAPTSYALSAVDLALWDLFGKLREAPVWQLIGGAGDREPVRCYATGLAVDESRSQGFRGFKLACPWGPDRSEALARTGELLRSTRIAIGDHTPLMLDCWAVNRPEDAAAIIELAAPYGLTWVEDYVVPEDDSAYIQVRAECPDATLASGERWYSVGRFERAIEQGWVNIVQPDALWVGGVTPTMRIAELADRHGVETSIHCGANDAFGQHLAYGLTANTWAEMYIGSEPGASLMDSYRATPGMALPIDGHIRPTDAPGFGIELTRTDIERLTN
jgi:L-rhamnonate dehydratase